MSRASERSARPTPSPSSIQETTLDLLWIADSVACFAGVGKRQLYRAVLSLAGPPEAFAGSEHAERALAGYAAVLNGLEHPVQFLVRGEALDISGYADRWETAALRLPPVLADLAREHAGWARQQLPELGLLERRLYLVVPAEQPTRPGGSLVAQFHRHLARSDSDRDGRAYAMKALSGRCGRLQQLLGSAGIRSSRLDDVALARLYRAGWGHAPGGEQRFDRDVRVFFAAAQRST
jgi:hypothetical protein